MLAVVIAPYWKRVVGNGPRAREIHNTIRHEHEVMGGTDYLRLATEMQAIDPQILSPVFRDLELPVDCLMALIAACSANQKLRSHHHPLRLRFSIFIEFRLSPAQRESAGGPPHHTHTDQVHFIFSRFLRCRHLESVVLASRLSYCTHVCALKHGLARKKGPSRALDLARTRLVHVRGVL